jgi:hypothetical protein
MRVMLPGVLAMTVPTSAEVKSKVYRLRRRSPRLRSAGPRGSFGPIDGGMG